MSWVVMFFGDKLMILNPEWEIIRKIGNSKILSLTIFIPVIGYMIIFNEQLVHMFELSKDIFVNTDLQNSERNTISNDTKTRLFYFYFGFTFLGIGSLLYQIFCPSLIKEHISDREYIQDGVALMTKKRFNIIRKHLSKNVDKSHFAELADLKYKFAISAEMNLEHGKNKRESLATDLMHLEWQYENSTNRILRSLIFILYGLGFITLAIPSLEMFGQVFLAFIK